MIRFWIWLRNILIAVVVLGVGGWLLLLREVPQPINNDPAFAFNHGSIGNEAAQGLPEWIWRVLPIVFPEHLPGDQKGWSALGVAWRSGDELPIGFSNKTLGVIPRIAPNCAFCHQGTYRLNAEDPETIVSAGAGTRVDVQGFIKFLIAVGQDDKFNARNIMPAIKSRVDMPLWERVMYRFVLIPGVRFALKGQAETFAWMQDNPTWGIGRIDPFNPVKYTALELPDDGTIGNSDMMPLWDLQAAQPTTHRRFSVHWDGLLSDVHETVVAGAIGDGMTYKSFPGAEENLKVIEDFSNVAMPPKSPFSSDLDPGDPFYVSAEAVAQGAEIYAGLCADCHEPSGTRFRTPIPMVEIGTDRHRLDMWTAEAARRYGNYQEDYAWNFEFFHKTDGYNAVPLVGLWLKGPYLHNGSVPNLAALLEAPKDRPTEFWRGSDLVDPVNGGFVSGEDDDPLRRSWKVDTSVPGNANTGHTWGTDLGQAEKGALLAYLKTL
ncbi:hypothetical protein AIOL_003799 [Candidatus Rhodobacter oscarellae]|uniref:Cytochrome c domain-containing protein n=1 Tax=Candidatus Rhodobacter oscarellae TaxID=1675527 RepID=A0A0J9EAX0_9RHOB|nr:hypothetical protein [Candidatus Rhodobacter lobularis]KMW58819.1 hypothetical protein AIOL_003799 [Candidatus Rhodobacter lobularis]